MSSASTSEHALADIAPSEWSKIAAETRGVFSDIDDTLTADGVLVPEAYAALVALRAAGLRIVLVTGRPLGWAEVLAAIFPIDAAIAENGAVAALPGGRRVYFEDEAARAEGLARREVARARVDREVPEVRPANDQALRSCDLAYDIAETVKHDEQTIAKVRAILVESGLSTTRSSIHLHGTYSLGDKAKMSVRIAGLLWSEPEDVVRDRYLFIGDSPNDAPAFAFFRHSIGVDNVRAHEAALRELGAFPWATVRERSGLGFARIAGALLTARPPKPT